MWRIAGTLLIKPRLINLRTVIGASPPKYSHASRILYAPRFGSKSDLVFTSPSCPLIPHYTPYKIRLIGCHGDIKFASARLFPGQKWSEFVRSTSFTNRISRRNRHFSCRDSDKIGRIMSSSPGPQFPHNCTLKPRIPENIVGIRRPVASQRATSCPTSCKRENVLKLENSESMP